MEIRNLFDKGFIARDETGFVARTVAFVARASAYRPQFVWADCAWGAAAVCAVIASILAAPGLPGLMGGALAATMMAIAAIDARLFIIPDKLVLAGLLLALINVSVAREGQLAAEFANAALRGGVLALLFFGGRTVYRLIRKRQGIGLGDVKLAAVAGVLARLDEYFSRRRPCRAVSFGGSACSCHSRPASHRAPPRFPSGFSSRRPSGWRGCLRRSTNA